MKIRRQVLNMVMLVAFLLLFVSEASVRADTKKAKQMPDAPRILSFTVTPARIAPGATAILQWSTANTERVLVAMKNQKKPLLTLRTSETSGSLEISPARTSSYKILAGKGSMSVSSEVTIEVMSMPTPVATCSITGQVSGKLDWDVTDLRGEPLQLRVRDIYMEVPGETANSSRARLQDRTYEFKNVPAGKTYRVFINTKHSDPEERVVVCQPNQTHTGIDFNITGPPRWEEG